MNNDSKLCGPISFEFNPKIFWNFNIFIILLGFRHYILFFLPKAYTTLSR